MIGQRKNDRSVYVLAAVFWALIMVFVVIVGMIVIPPVIPEFRKYFVYIFFPASAMFLLLGLTLIFLGIKARVTRTLRRFLILTGASAAGFPISVLLHNLIYGLFIYWFGADFWSKTGVGDEPLFFIIAIIICPIGFLVGAGGSIVIFARKKLAK